MRVKSTIRIRHQEPVVSLRDPRATRIRDANDRLEAVRRQAREARIVGREDCSYPRNRSQPGQVRAGKDTEVATRVHRRLHLPLEVVVATSRQRFGGNHRDEAGDGLCHREHVRIGDAEDSHAEQPPAVARSIRRNIDLS